MSENTGKNLPSSGTGPLNAPPPETFPTLGEMLDSACRRAPDRVALVTASSRQTFAQTREDVLKAASAFRARGVRRGDAVAIVLRNSPEFIVAYFALAHLGAVAVPINFLIQKAEELRFMLNDCSAVGVVTQKEFLPGLLKARETLPGLKSVWTTDSSDAENFRDFVRSAPPLAEAVPVSPDDTCAILYTSGTTGHPKGVMLSHSNLSSNADASIRALGVTERDVFLAILPMFHSFAWTACVLVALRAGGKLVIAPSVTPPKPWLTLMGRHGVTLFAAIPPLYAVLAKEAQGWKGFVLRHWFFRKVRVCVSGAAPLSADVSRAFEEKFRVPLLEGYGLTETSPVATLNPLGAERTGSVGKAIEGVRVKIIAEDESALPASSEGEICIRGPNVMKGYFRLPEATREAFTRDGWFKTGDIGTLDADGYLYLRDRKKDMIINKGLKIFSAQVEQVIAQHPDVEEAAIIGVPDEAGNETIKAFVVLKPGAKADKAALAQFCRSKLDPYKRPRDIEIVDSLPKNALQKVLKHVLRRRELDKKKSR